MIHPDVYGRRGRFPAGAIALSGGWRTRLFLIYRFRRIPKSGERY